MLKLVCDYCQSEILNKSIYFEITLKPNDNDIYRYEKTITLCPDCARCVKPISVLY